MAGLRLLRNKCQSYHQEGLWSWSCLSCFQLWELVRISRGRRIFRLDIEQRGFASAEEYLWAILSYLETRKSCRR